MQAEVRYKRYKYELQRKLRALEVENATLSNQITMLQRDTSILESRNEELMLHVHYLEKILQSRQAFIDSFMEKAQQLRIEMGETVDDDSGSMMNYDPSQVSPSNYSMQHLSAANQFQQPQNQAQQQHQLPEPTGNMGLYGSMPSTQVDNSADNNPQGMA